MASTRAMLLATLVALGACLNLTLSQEQGIPQHCAADSEALLLGEMVELQRNFQQQPARILMAATHLCRSACAFAGATSWRLTDDWPDVARGSARYGDASALVAYSADMQALLDRIAPNQPTSAFRVAASKQIISLYLDDASRAQLGLDVDASSAFVQHLRGLGDSFDTRYLRFDFHHRGTNDTRLINTVTRQLPWLVTAGGNGKLLDAISNYVPMKWHQDLGCLHCVNDATQHPEHKVVMALVVELRSPFLRAVLERLAQQSLSPQQMALIVGIEEGDMSVTYTSLVQNFTEEFKDSFASIQIVAGLKGRALREALFQGAAAVSGFQGASTFLISSLTYLTNPNTTAHLLNENQSVLAPVLPRHQKLYSNFWGAIDGDARSHCHDFHATCPAWQLAGECETNEVWMSNNCAKACQACQVPGDVQGVRYKRSWDYRDIATREVQGVCALLLKPTAALALQQQLSTSPEHENYLPVDWDLKLTEWLHAAKFEVKVDNQESFGTLIDPTNFDSRKTHPDMFLVEANPEPWADIYIHPDYQPYKKLDFVQGRCWDIYNFPLFSEQFCGEMIQWAETMNLWSGGDNKDKRLKGGYEPVPTRDIHFNQMDFQSAWSLSVLFGVRALEMV
ncbi:uncharacterized protein MONBRDRAFT_28874 [Monosiga brevicollis MX1]|uniref:ShKT domain-containing protein n=1 Tax=Monosiga brevicollis TaxID=81824 RepID=A9V9B3_MONBE|nr:uncharacterized protein MONBRDRAFT_28874 [Monosiga brevicollis MX1]EDQ85830.1 predicted protein [Monosiga brevicollis MX1]|eukprot:XP_001749309.1 hypothetical protein [Monosiga brevicollis MX1]